MKRALLIGIDYLAIPSITLNGCIYDVINIGHVLIDAYNYDSVTILRDDMNNPATMPTRANIINNLRLLAQQSTALDEIWVHYSGHGSQIPDKTAYAGTGLNQILVPCDYQTAGFIIDKELFAIAKNIKCKTLFIFDACHSGTMCDLQWSYQYVTPTAWTKTQNNTVALSNPNIYMISGCKDDQTSADAFIKTDQTAQGAFTSAFITALRYYRHNVSITNVYQYVCGYLIANGLTQTPVLSCSAQTPVYSFVRAAPTITAPIANLASTTSVIVKNMRSILYP
jgi:hypothetical protein